MRSERFERDERASEAAIAIATNQYILRELQSKADKKIPGRGECTSEGIAGLATNIYIGRELLRRQQDELANLARKRKEDPHRLDPRLAVVAISLIWPSKHASYKLGEQAGIYPEVGRLRLNAAVIEIGLSAIATISSFLAK